MSRASKGNVWGWDDLPPKVSEWAAASAANGYDVWLLHNPNTRSLMAVAVAHKPQAPQYAVYTIVFGFDGVLHEHGRYMTLEGGRLAWATAIHGGWTAHPHRKRETK